MKYIDAEKLKRAIEKLSEKEYNDGTLGDDVANGALDYVIAIINRLQQEQEEPSNIAEYYYHKGVYEGLYQGHADAQKILEEFAKRNAYPVIVIKQQEQQEVDLERDAVQFCFDKGLNLTPYQAKTIARHFYELGKNSK